MTLQSFIKSDFLLISLRYALDWVLVVGFTVAATFLGAMDGARRPFNPYDQDYSYPYGEDTVSVLMMGIVAIAGPAAIILLTCFFIPRSALPALADRKNVPTSVVWKHRLLNWNRAWLGLGLTSALAFFISNTLKNVIGKPRPNMLAVCDVDWEKVADFVKTTRTGPLDILAWNPIMRAEDICRQQDNHLLAEAFRSFPSGHATMAFSGMTYMSLFFYSTLVLTLKKSSVHKLPYSTSDLRKRDDDDTSSSTTRHRVSKLHPPSLPLITFVVVICFFCLAMWIACTRYLDFKHAGVDLLAGALLGFSSAICGTWWYAMPAAGGVGKGRVRAGYREEARRQMDVPLEEYDQEPRGPLGAGERVSLSERTSLRQGEYEEHQMKERSPPVESIRPTTAVSHV